MTTRILRTPFGVTPDGVPATLYTFENRHGMLVKISDIGGTVTQIHVPDRHGKLADVTLGFDSVAPYDSAPYFGALVGRYANRIAGGRFTLDGRDWQLPVNNGANHLHGGPRGFNRVLWDAVPFETAQSSGLTLRYVSADGEQGYPGTLSVTVVYELSDENELAIRFHAVTDAPTPVNLTNHAYFNLAGIGAGDVLGHEMQIDAQTYTPVNADLIPLGELAPVAGTPFDFRTPQTIGGRIGQEDAQLRVGQGYDHNFVLDKPQGGTLDKALDKATAEATAEAADQPAGQTRAAYARAARVREPVSGRVLEVWTDEPGVQFYSGNFLDGSLSGKGATYGLRSGFCLEPQHFPDSPNQPAFPDTILRPGQVYASRMAYRFSVAH